MNPIAEKLFNYMRDVIYDSDKAKLELDSLPEDFRDLGEGMKFFANCIMETNEVIKDLSKGRLDISLPSLENEIAAPVKNLHGKMKHLTWQAKQITRGDFSQRIDFIGEFSDAFNTMAEQLESHRTGLMKEIEDGELKTKALEQNCNLFQTIFNKISQWVIVVSKGNYKWLYMNHNVDEILKSPSDEKTLRHWMNDQVDNFLNKDVPGSAELELRQDDGSYQYFSIEIHPLSWHKHDALVFMLTDVSSKKEQMSYLHNMAYTDMLTKVHNRCYAMDVLNQWLEQNKTFILCFVDMDNLKYVNDNYGHSEGDNYIVKVAEVLSEFSPETVLSRMGGDEFMLLAENWQMDSATERMESLRKKLLSHKNDDDDFYDSNISYGIIEVNKNNKLAVCELLGIADERMYEYKRAHKRRKIVCDITEG